MANHTPRYIIATILFCIVAGLTYWVRLKPTNVSFDADFRSFPLQIGSYHGLDTPVGDEQQKGIEADSIMARTYSPDDGSSRISILAVYRKYGRRGFVHRPEMCYPAAGYELSGKCNTTITYNGRTIPVVKMLAERDGEKELLLYWFVSGDRVQGSYVRQQYAMALDRLQPQKYGWAFIRVGGSVTSSEEETLSDMQKFISKASGALSNSLTKNGNPKPGARDRSRAAHGGPQTLKNASGHALGEN